MVVKSPPPLSLLFKKEVKCDNTFFLVTFFNVVVFIIKVACVAGVNGEGKGE